MLLPEVLIRNASGRDSDIKQKQGLTPKLLYQEYVSKIRICWDIDDTEEEALKAIPQGNDLDFAVNFLLFRKAKCRRLADKVLNNLTMVGKRGIRHLLSMLLKPPNLAKSLFKQF